MLPEQIPHPETEKDREGRIFLIPSRPLDRPDGDAQNDRREKQKTDKSPVKAEGLFLPFHGFPSLNSRGCGTAVHHGVALASASGVSGIVGGVRAVNRSRRAPRIGGILPGPRRVGLGGGIRPLLLGGLPGRVPLGILRALPGGVCLRVLRIRICRTSLLSLTGSPGIVGPVLRMLSGDGILNAPGIVGTLRGSVIVGILIHGGFLRSVTRYYLIL